MEQVNRIETVYATGGKGNPKLLAWQYTTINVEDGYESVFPPQSKKRLEPYYISLNTPPRTVRRKGRIIRREEDDVA
ncbi:hypothetical protein AAXB25_14370 [Paenibacillus lautus]|uniref:hypothetical protein n=1 Tax=Paenibacillus lautus TaxID=1401 RepID=UPI003D2A5859